MERSRQRATNDWLEQAYYQVEIALMPLPDGYVIEKSEPDEAIFVHRLPVPERLPEGMGFAITKWAIEHGMLKHTLDAFHDLVKLVDAKLGASGEP